MTDENPTPSSERPSAPPPAPAEPTVETEAVVEEPTVEDEAAPSWADQDALVDTSAEDAYDAWLEAQAPQDGEPEPDAPTAEAPVDELAAEPEEHPAAPEADPELEPATEAEPEPEPDLAAEHEADTEPEPEADEEPELELTGTPVAAAGAVLPETAEVAVPLPEVEPEPEPEDQPHDDDDEVEDDEELDLEDEDQLEDELPVATVADEPEPEPAAVEVADGSAITAGRPGGPLLVALVALVVVLAALAGVLGLKSISTRGGSGLEDARRDALGSARNATRLVFSYDYRHLDKDFKAGKAVTTGAFAGEYDRTTARLVDDVAVRYKAVVVADVSDAAVVRAAKDKVVVLVFVNQKSSSTLAAGTKVTLSRLEMTMVHRDGRWLVEKIKAF